MPNTPWEELLNTSLLGTEKATLSVEKMPPALEQIMARTDLADREGKLLKTTALLWQYNRTGQQAPVVVVGQEVPVAAPETLAYAPRNATQLLEKILNEEPVNLPLLALLLQKIQTQALLIPPAYLVTLLNIGTDKKAEYLRPALQAVSGNRGKWLLQYDTNWQWLQQETPNYLTRWQEGKTAERREALHRLRGQDPATARALLQADWPQLSARERKDLLDCLRVGFGSDDEPFLRQIQHELGTAKENSKPVNQEIKQLVVSLLVTLPQSEEQMLLTNALSHYLKKERKLLITKQIKIQIPAASDAFLNEEQFCQRWGFGNVNPDAYQFETLTEYWFVEAVSLVNPELWLELLQTDWAGVVNFFKETERNLKNVAQPARETALQTAALRFKNADLAFALVTQLPNQANNDKLLNLLSMSQLEAVFRQLSFVKLIHKRDALLRVGEEWSLSFTRYVLAEVFQMLATSNYYQHTNPDFLKRAVVAMHPSIEKELTAVVPVGAAETAKQSWYEKYVPFLADLLAVRRSIEALHED
jgi:Family of unknown function (DUF5691)